MEMISTAAMTLPLVLWQTPGRKADSDTEEHQHTEGQEIGFTQGVRQVSGQKVEDAGPQG